jgi:hypothetical protein
LAAGRTFLMVWFSVGRQFHFTIGSSLHKLEKLSLVLKAMNKADMLNKRRFASISIKNCLADTDHRLISNLAQQALRFASADQFFRTGTRFCDPKERYVLSPFDALALA